MSIQGSLEDVAVAEVLQFVHLGSSTGTLVLTRDDERVEIGFHDGGIINAWDSRSLRLGELLVARGLVSRDVVECALGLQATKPEPVPSIGEILVGEGFVSPENLRATVVEQIRQSISRAIEWTRGSFVFVKGAPRRRDQFDPDAVLTYKLNTQALLLDIARTLDHARNGMATTSAEVLPVAVAEAAEPEAGLPLPVPHVNGARPALGEAAAAAAGGDDDDATDGVDDSVDGTAAAAADEDLGLGAEQTSLPQVRVVSDASRFAGELLPGLDCEVELLRFRDPRLLALPPAPVLVIDLRRDRSLDDLAEVVATSPGVAPIVLLPDVSLAAGAYALGARAVIPDQPGALAGYVGAMLAAHGAPIPGRRETPAESHGFARLREIFADLRDSAPSATRILGLLRVASDFAQRAAVFVVLGDQVRVIGAFGRSVDGRPLADVLRKAGAFALAGALREAADRRAVVTRSYDEELLPDALAAALGPPSNHRFLVVPVTGGDKVILLVYLDNDDRAEPIAGLDVIELAGAHIGLMFENELLKRRFAIAGRERREPTVSSGSG